MVLKNFIDEFQEVRLNKTGCLNPNRSQFGTFVNSPSNNDPTTIDIYIIANACGFAGAFIGNNKIVVRADVDQRWHTVHEMGHAFQLAHTHGGYEHFVLDENDVLVPNTECERVTRIETNSKFNAYDNGDCIKDTAAMPRFGGTHYGQSNAVDEVNCDYLGNGTDCFRVTPYQISPIDLKNVMNNGTECPQKALEEDNVGFTDEQGHRMRYGLESGIYSSFLAQVDNDGDFSSLYEPYKGTYYVSGPPQDPADAPHFQPGFDYDFVACYCYCNSCPIPECDYQPSEYSNTNFQTNSNVVLSIDKYEDDYSKIVQPNHSAIRILSLPVSHPITSPRTRRCYDNNNINANYGQITKFNDGVFNGNVTITPMDSIQINNPQMVEELPNGLYVIDKNFDDGSTDQQVVQKDGNN